MSSAALALPTPLSTERSALLAQFAAGADATGLLWASGYLAGLARSLEAPASTPVAAASTTPATVLYGSQTGNARRAAEALHAALAAAGLPARLLRADAYPLRELKDERLLYIAISTQGDGDPPDDAQAFVEFLSGKRAPRLPQLKYAVLALGDSSYPRFCAIGQRLDARLAELGASRVADCANADLDVGTVATPWTANAVGIARALLEQDAPKPGPLATVVPLRPHAVAQAHDHQHPFAAELLANQRIVGRAFKGTGFRRYGDIDKDVRHIELSLEGSGLAYEPGDALGIRHRNPESLVAALLEATKLDGDAAIAADGDTLPLSEWLAARRELTRLSRPFLAALAERTGAQELHRLLEPGNDGLAALLADHQLIDVLRRWPGEWDAPALLAALRPQARRLYSIASSRKRVGEEAHLAVDVLGYNAHGHDHIGAASGFLAALAEGSQVPVYVEANERFRVPADAGRDIIMVGPGTGVAPFRGFVQERAETGATGRNWLFFGARHFDTGFLYQAEWQDALRTGELHRLDLAFSRDQAERIHVQRRLRENGRDVLDWLQGGAHFYVCGAIAMGRDVHAALLDIVAAHNGGDAGAADGFLKALQAEGRYARDLY